MEDQQRFGDVPDRLWHIPLYQLVVHTHVEPGASRVALTRASAEQLAVDSLGFVGNWVLRACIASSVPVELRSWGGIKAAYRND